MATLLVKHTLNTVIVHLIRTKKNKFPKMNFPYVRIKNHSFKYFLFGEKGKFCFLFYSLYIFYFYEYFVYLRLMRHHYNPTYYLSNWVQHSEESEAMILEELNYKICGPVDPNIMEIEMN